MNRDTVVVPVESVEAGTRESRSDFLAAEEPLEIRLNGSPISVTMRTPGEDRALAAGFLFTEGIVASFDQIISIEANEKNWVNVQLKPEVEFDPDQFKRNFYATSSCGICGKASIDAIHGQRTCVMPPSGPIFSSEMIHRLPDVLRERQRVFDRTGGLHAAALFSIAGEILALKEDIGRHNAVDKVIGVGIEQKLPFGNSLIFVSGRAGFELIQKAAMAGIPILAAVGAPSSLAVQAAARFGMTLLGFVRAGRFNSYTNGWRIH